MSTEHSTHEKGSAKIVPQRVMIMDERMILEGNAQRNFFEHPEHKRTKFFFKPNFRLI